MDGSGSETAIVGKQKLGDFLVVEKRSRKLASVLCYLVRGLEKHRKKNSGWEADRYLSADGCSFH